MASTNPPVFTAVSSSARRLFFLLRCIGFSSKADVQITTDGLRFSVEEFRAVQGLTLLEKTLFSAYTFNVSSLQDSSTPDETASTPSFQINLSALLETLQIFGLSDASSTSSRSLNSSVTSSSYSHNPFNSPSLALTGGTCRISYPYLGAPLSITISEAGVTTTCDLNTYESSSGGVEFDVDESIPLQRDSLTLKIIMKSTWLYDAINELASTNPTILVLTASKHTPPLFALEGSGGPFGDSSVDFQPEQSRSRDRASNSNIGTDRNSQKQAPLVTETFSVLPPPGSRGQRVRQRYKFELIQKAAKAMALASKVCIRCDGQGVLSLQFMIELFGNGASKNGDDGSGVGVSVVGGRSGSGSGSRGEKMSFVDFRFVPLLDEEDGDGEEEEDTDVGGEERDARFDLVDGSTESGE